MLRMSVWNSWLIIIIQVVWLSPDLKGRKESLIRTNYRSFLIFLFLSYPRMNTFYFFIVSHEKLYQFQSSSGENLRLRDNCKKVLNQAIFLLFLISTSRALSFLFGYLCVTYNNSIFIMLLVFSFVLFGLLGASTWCVGLKKEVQIIEARKEFINVL